MDAKFVFSFLLAFVVSQAYPDHHEHHHHHHESYQDSFKACLKEVKLEKDDALKSYMSTGKFASDKEAGDLKCFFSCLAQRLDISDANGKLDGPKIKKLAEENPTETELVAFSNDEVQKACIPLPEKYKDLSATACDAVYSFTQCALETQASKKP